MPLGAFTTLSDNLWLTIFGVGLVTAGFFGGHSIASSWVGLRAEKARSQASALCLFFYYLGSSVAGTVGGVVLARTEWPGVAGFVGGSRCSRFSSRCGFRACRRRRICGHRRSSLTLGVRADCPNLNDRTRPKAAFRGAGYAAA